MKKEPDTISCVKKREDPQILETGLDSDKICGSDGPVEIIHRPVTELWRKRG